MEDLMMSRTLDPSNAALQVKMNVVAESPDAMHIPTSLMEERLINPYLKYSNPEIQAIIKESNPTKYIQKLKLI
jgi:hypothetical protein